MSQHPPGRDQYDVHPHIVARLHVPRAQIFGRGGDPCEPIFVDREVQFGPCLAPFDLHKGDQIAFSRYQIDLSGPGSNPSRKDSPPLQTQPPRRRSLPDAPRTLSFSPVSHPFIASARA